MGQALGLPAQELVERAGVGADVIAGDDVGIQKPGRAFINSNPTPLWLLAATQTLTMSGLRFVGQYVPGADVLAVLLRHGKLRHAAAARVVVVVQLGGGSAAAGAYQKFALIKSMMAASSPRRASRNVVSDNGRIPRDRQRYAGDEACLVGEQERHGGYNVRGRCVAAMGFYPPQPAR